MINTLKNILKIDSYYSINSVIYYLKKIPILGVFLPNDMYSKKNLKKIIYVTIIIYRILKGILLNIIYFSFIYFLSKLLSYKLNISDMYIYIYLLLSLISIIFSSKLFNPNKKNYLLLIVFNINKKEYIKINLIFNFIKKFIYHCLILIPLFNYLHIPVIKLIEVLIISCTCQIISEGTKLNKLNNRKNGIVLFIMTFLYLLFIIYNKALPIISIVSIIMGIYYYKTIITYKNYNLLFKRTINIENSMSKISEVFYDQNTLQLNTTKINIDKIKNKKGYDYFNTIFFERHKTILLKSSYIFSIVIILLIIITSSIILLLPKYKIDINNFLTNYLGVFVFVMYFINRGEILTKAMFYHCDHSMLTYNFYRNKKVILNLYKKRLLTTIKINLIPAITLGIGLIIISNLVNINVVNSILIFLFIIILSIFFSVHYLTLYYLLQPYNKNLEIKDFRYNIICFITYYIAYKLISVHINSTLFSIYGLLFTVLYITISLILIYLFSSKTFKLK